MEQSILQISRLLGQPSQTIPWMEVICQHFMESNGSMELHLSGKNWTLEAHWLSLILILCHRSSHQPLNRNTEFTQKMELELVLYTLTFSLYYVMNFLQQLLLYPSRMFNPNLWQFNGLSCFLILKMEEMFLRFIWSRLLFQLLPQFGLLSMMEEEWPQIILIH